MREACGTRDENEDHEDALFVVLVLPPLLALLFAVVKKVPRVSLLVFAFVRILVVVAKPPLCVDVFGTSDPPTLSPIREREHALHRTDEEEEGEEEGGAAATNDDDIDALIIIEIVSVVFLNGA